MKKLLICLCATLLLASCDIDDGKEYKDPNLYRYDNEYEEESFSWEDGYEAGYDEGFYDGCNAGFDEMEGIVEAAIDYVIENGGWHPGDEALPIIEMYRTKISYHPDGSLPTKEEYYEAINSLIYFYEFFEYGLYERYYDPER